MAAQDIPLPAINIMRYLELSPEEIALAILSLIVGFIAVHLVSRRIMVYARDNMKIPQIMAIHIVTAIKLFLYLVVVLIALSFLDEDIDAIILSVSAVVMFIFGFGLQDTINNFASGIWIASSRAYDIEDEVTIAGHRGFVKDMNIMATEVKLIDNTRVIIPNGKVWNNPIVNVSRMPTRMIVIEYSVSYNTVISEAVNVALRAARKHPKIHSSPAPIVRFKDMADSAVILQLRGWTDTEDYYPVKSELMTMLFEELNEAGIHIPYPQMDVHMKED
jgi:small-conductance mechanosensitive channel